MESKFYSRFKLFGNKKHEMIINFVGLTIFIINKTKLDLNWWAGDECTVGFGGIFHGKFVDQFQKTGI